MQKFFEFLKELLDLIFNSKKQIPEKNEKDKELVPPQVTVPPVDTKKEIDWRKWSDDALMISKRFEGSDGWANITGNFDGAGLTCGALGWTFKWYNQQPLVLKFIGKHGEELLRQLMPACGDQYIYLVKIKKESEYLPLVSKWTSQTRTSQVLEPFQTDLRRFWNSPEMIEIQRQAASVSMGEFAKKKCLESQEFFKLPEPVFFHYSYWFDQAVLNGQGKTVNFSEVGNLKMSDVFDWMKKETGYAQRDFNLNLSLWATLKNVPRDREVLFIMAYLRAIRARDEFDTVTMNRRGTLALGQGWVNGKRWLF